ncbi:MAG: LysM domain-containing protein [bacterium]
MKPKFGLILFLVLVSIAISNIPTHSWDNDKLQNYQIHTVKAGDSLSKIAYEYCGDYTQVVRIAKFNDIKDIDNLKIGQKIKIPVLSLGKSKKPSSVNEEDIDISKHGEAETLEEKSLNKGPISSQLDRPAVIFIIIYLLTMLSLVLIKWLGLKDIPHIQEPNDDKRIGFKRRKWRML